MYDFFHEYFNDSFIRHDLKNLHEVSSSEYLVMMDEISHGPISTASSPTSPKPSLYQKLLSLLPLKDFVCNIETPKVVYEK